jgi:adenylosuccinate lyase
MGKLVLNEAKLDEDLNANWMVTAEAIQTVLRREGYPQPYEALKDLTRGKSKITKEDIHEFIEKLEISFDLKQELKMISPQNYTGIW